MRVCVGMWEVSSSGLEEYSGLCERIAKEVYICLALTK